jgi:peptide/nickel transport system substrate-binding protein
MLAGCDPGDRPARSSQLVTTLTIGLGVAAGGGTAAAVPATVRNLSIEGLLSYAPDGRPESRLAESWTPSEDRLRWRIKLRPDVTFHDGERMTAPAVRKILETELPGHLGQAYSDVESIEAPSEDEIEFVLKHPSNFLVEGLDVPIQKRGNPAIGTGPFYASSPVGPDSEAELLAHSKHYLGSPAIDRLIVRPYNSLRGAWADMLRGHVDMLYEVGVDALDLLEAGTQTQIYTFQRPYAYMLIFNMRRERLRDARVRRQLNSAIDRHELIADTLRGHATPATGPVLPQHWANDGSLAEFKYEPVEIAPIDRPLRVRCMYYDRANERLALGLQKQLRSVGVDLILEQVPSEVGDERLGAGDFDTFLVDAVSGPTVWRTSLFWQSGSPYNFGHFDSTLVNLALDRLRAAPTEADYKAAVAGFQQAMIDDPPAIFVAWSQRARAVSRRFEVPAEPGRDILRSLRLWRLASDNLDDTSN